MRRVLVTGSRVWSDSEAIHEALDREYERSPSGMIVVHGAARGADTIAWQWAMDMFYQRHLVKHEAHHADWDRYQLAAGHVRNAEMVKLGASVCLAFPLGDSRGTRGCMKLAERARIPVINYGK